MSKAVLGDVEWHTHTEGLYAVDQEYALKVAQGFPEASIHLITDIIQLNDLGSICDDFVVFHMRLLRIEG